MSQATVYTMILRLAAAGAPKPLAEVLPDATSDQRSKAATLAQRTGLARVEGHGAASRWTLTQHGEAAARSLASRGGLGGH